MTHWLVRVVSVLAGVGLAACGSSDEPAFGGDGGAGSAGAAGSGGAGDAGAAGSGASSGAAGAAGASSECSGSHPIVEGDERVCAVGQCRCPASDLCFASDQAARCCDGEIRCFTADGPVACEGSHPIVDGDARSCEPGDCYCEPRDACFPSAIAALCCAAVPKCG